MINSFWSLALINKQSAGISKSANRLTLQVFVNLISRQALELDHCYIALYCYTCNWKPYIEEDSHKLESNKIGAIGCVPTSELYIILEYVKVAVVFQANFTLKCSFLSFVFSAWLCARSCVPRCINVNANTKTSGLTWGDRSGIYKVHFSSLIIVLDRVVTRRCAARSGFQSD